tara:strand:+ start:29171 stop:29440 length:270 start_codon:yes stop_codon:yes gene_type:complete
LVLRVTIFTAIKIAARVMGGSLETKRKGENITSTPTMMWTDLRLVSTVHLSLDRAASLRPMRKKITPRKTRKVIHSFSKGENVGNITIK